MELQFPCLFVEISHTDTIHSWLVYSREQFQESYEDTVWEYLRQNEDLEEYRYLREESLPCRTCEPENDEVWVKAIGSSVKELIILHGLDDCGEFLLTQETRPDYERIKYIIGSFIYKNWVEKMNALNESFNCFQKTRSEGGVPKLHLTKEQMAEAVKRAAEHVKTLPPWRDKR